jgi:hypothetical protein
VAYGDNGIDKFYINSLNTVLFAGDSDDILTTDAYFYNGLLFGGNGNDKFIDLGGNASERKTYAWGGAGSDYFEISKKLPSYINWIMDFDARNPDVGGDKINFFLGRTDFNWATSGTNLEKKSADAKHPFLSEGADYYDLQINTNPDVNNPIWFSVLNLVGVDGTEITLQGLIDNKNLV